MFDRSHPLLSRISLETVLATVPSGLFVVDREQRIRYWNAEAERITGFSSAEAVGQHCSFLAGIPCGKGCGLFDPDLPKPVIGVSCSVLHKDGKRIFLAKNVDYLRDDQGQIVGGIESFVDITRRKRLEHRLRRHSRDLEQAVQRRTAELDQERSRLATVLDSMKDFAYLVGEDFRIRFINRAMSEVFGQVSGEPCYRVFHQREDPCPWCPMDRVLAGEVVLEERGFETNRRHYEIIHSPLVTAEGKLEKLAVHRDITERKMAEQKLREANRELDAFVYTVSHDLRSPLTPIIGFADFLREEYRDRLDAQGLELLSEIENQGQKMLALMEDLLTLSRVGRIEPPAKPVATGDLVRQIVAAKLQELDQPHLAVTVGELPPLAIPATLLEDLFGNLIHNAICYGGGGFEIAGTTAGDLVQILVRDHGPGIPANERQRIFDAFYRGSTTRQTPGTGIGLATVRKIARLYGGRAWVEETPGGGATFLLEFPA